ncbi:MAG: hypothetical protein V3U54_08940 [Thermodesulfobacteriota bacterium]
MRLEIRRKITGHICKICQKSYSSGQWYIEHNKYLCNKCSSKRYYRKNRRYILTRMKQKYYKNHNDFLKKGRRNYSKHRVNRLLEKKEYTKLNYDKILKYQRLYKRNRLQNDIEYRLASNLRQRIRTSLQRGQLKKYDTHLSMYLGCTLGFFVKHIKSQWIPEMNWTNYGTVWQLDHIKPLCSFDLNKKIEFLQATNYKNIQPLIKKEHYKKTAIEIQKFRSNLR